ncbi:CotY/CotZ family spore coat protein [Salibacterium halotolerans]|uniref:Spore coat protein Z n=1 Tax=Salibacterium halotolerans TaxID=1884432 RepID=A0A1I5R3P4_9BACI|nr:CotY/CotZ family spore coat protein [Salibacterium halotolerans]SFP52941.1 spore coat protein Z [Salibacterium halotolerans]
MRKRRQREEEMEDTAREEVRHSKDHCVCDTLLHIKKAQDEAEERNNPGCRNSCYSSLLSGQNNNNGRDTVPFLLQGKDGSYLHAVGSIGERYCFQTVFFRVEKVSKEDCCAVLSLLRPDCPIDFDKCCVDPWSLCDVEELSRTRECIHVDLKCFCTVQCLDPELVED